MRFRCLILFAAMIAAILPFRPSVAAPTAEQRAEILALGTLLTKAGNLYKEKKFKEAGEAIKEAQTRLAKVAEGADQQTIGQLAPLHKRLANAHSLLELEGVSLPELKPLEENPAAKPAADKTAAKASKA